MFIDDKSKGRIFRVTFINISVCKEENHWAVAKANKVMVRVWASDQHDYEPDFHAYVGLRGINITLKVIGLFSGQQFGHF